MRVAEARGCSRLRRLIGDASLVIFTVTRALPYDDRQRATVGLRRLLGEEVAAAGKFPNWATLVLEGPTEVTGLHGRTWFEWTATVEDVSP